MGPGAVNEVPAHAEYSDDEKKKEIYPRGLAKKYHFMEIYLDKVKDGQTGMKALFIDPPKR